MKRRKKNAQLAAKIRAAAKRDPVAAIEVAMHGRVRSKVEKKLDAYRLTRNAMLACIAAKQPPQHQDRMNWTSAAEESLSELCNSFVAAVETRNAATLREMADHLERDRKQDDTRSHLLCLKKILDERGEKMSVARLASLLQLKRSSAQDDGNSSVRRLAKELGFPVAQSRRGRKKSA